MGILRIILFVIICSSLQAQFIEIPVKFLDNKVPVEWQDSQDRTFKEYAINYTIKDNYALVFIGHYRKGETSRLNETQKEEIELWLKYFNTKLITDEKIIDNYRAVDNI